MTRSARKTCIMLAAACVLAAACATDTPPADTKAAPGAVSGTPAAAQRPFGLQQPPAQRPSSAPGAAQAAPKGVPAQRSVYYDFDRYDVKPEFRPAIEAHARYLRDHAGARITIEGNGDERGSREYNLALGQRRAESVRQMMRLSGAADQQIETVSFGEEKPMAAGHDEVSWAENRRSDFVYQRSE
jgi:peptidoglycan-associated lipoprotein